MTVTARGEAADVIVVGAGPAGAAAAFQLARAGLDTLLLERRTHPREKSCGDAVTRVGVRKLAEIGVLDRLDGAWPVSGVRVRMREGAERVFRYAASDFALAAIVVPRVELDHAICSAAVDAGARLAQSHEVLGLVQRDGRVAGVRVAAPEGETTFSAPIVVAADGARSRLAREAGLVATGQASLGTAIRGYFHGLEGLDRMLELHFPVTDPSGRYTLPSYGWVFPTGAGTANVGIGLFERVRAANVRELYERFVGSLLDGDERFQGARPGGRVLGAPLRFDFAPERCVADGLFLVGDAAGMVSPFTGEGIAYALHSGQLAAEAITARLTADGVGRRSTSLAAESDALRSARYVASLRRHYGGFFETGRLAATRYRLAWRVLERTFHNERPLFRLARRAAIVPEGIGSVAHPDVVDDVGHLLPGLVGLRPYLAAVDEMLVDTVRREWPFVARLAITTRGLASVPLRAGIIVFLTGAFGNRDDARLVPTAAALELVSLATIAFASTSEAGEVPERGPDWASAVAVTTGDLALAKAMSIVTNTDTVSTLECARGLVRVCRGYSSALAALRPHLVDPETYVRSIYASAGAAWAATCRIAGVLADVPGEQIDALERFASHAAVAYQLREEAVAVTGEPPFAEPIEQELGRGLMRLPALAAAERDVTARDVLTAIARAAADGGVARGDATAATESVRAADGAQLTLRRAATAARQASEALATLPATPARRALDGIAGYALTRPAVAAVARR